MRKVTAEMSSEGVMAGVGVVGVNPCVHFHFPFDSKHTATATRSFPWQVIREGHD